MKCPVCGNRGRQSDRTRFAPIAWGTYTEFGPYVWCRRCWSRLIKAPFPSFGRVMVVDDALWRDMWGEHPPPPQPPR